MAVDNEPEPFWDGADQEQRVGTWRATVGCRSEWGEIDVARELNGSSGKWVVKNVLEPLHLTRADCWITDALNTYRCSSDLAARLKDTYAPTAAKLGLPAASLQEHPSEDEIVNESKAHHLDRLAGELRDAAPERVVTLGNAALRVLRDLLGAGHLPRVLSSNAADYAVEFDVVLSHGPAKVLPLAHPAAPKPYQLAHAGWLAGRATR
jgi:hypothetical protein